MDTYNHMFFAFFSKHKKNDLRSFCTNVTRLKLNDLYTHEIAKLMFKYAHKTTPIAFSSFFTPVISIHTRTTRLASYSNNLYLPRYKTNKMQRSFKFQGVKIWNSIPNDLRKLSFNQFKMKYKKILLSNY